MRDSFIISISEFGNFKNPIATITSLPACFFRFRRFILSSTNQKSDFYELCQQRKQLKTIEMSEASAGTYEGYMHQLQPEPTHKIHEQQQKHQA